MVRDAFRLFCCAGLILGIVIAVPAASEEQNQKIEKTLRWQKALSQGRDALQRGHFQAAVDLLEGEVEVIAGDKDYLAALRDAYLGLIRELRQKNANAADIASYQRRLNNVAPGALLELKTPATPAPAPVKEVEPTPVVQTVPKTQPQPATPVQTTVEVIDPLSDANRLADPEAQKLVVRADEAFGARRYAEACQLFEQAAKTDPESVASARERWAYCKLHRVVASLNQAPGDSAAVPAQELEREVRLALSMAAAPKVKEFGQNLLRKIQDRQGGGSVGAGEITEEAGPIEVRHTPRQGQWAVAETKNFRIHHTQEAEFGERVARAAEAARVAASRKWFGEVPPTWTPPCDVFLHVNREDYSKATGQPGDCPGHSTIETAGERVTKRQVDLHCDDVNMITGVLPHETTHVVLAGQFGKQALPRWVDEGMAVLSEPRERVELHLRNLPQHRRDRQLFLVADLMQYQDYPEGKYIGAFYAQSVSLVDYLTQLKGSQAFTQFVRDGLREGFEPSLRRHYGMESFTDLQNRWQVAVFREGNSQSASARPSR